MASVTPSASSRPQGARPQFCRRFLRPYCRLLGAGGFTTAKAYKPLRSLAGLPPRSPFIGGISLRSPSKYRQARPHFAGVPSASWGSRPTPRFLACRSLVSAALPPPAPLTSSPWRGAPGWGLATARYLLTIPMREWALFGRCRHCHSSTLAFWSRLSALPRVLILLRLPTCGLAAARAAAARIRCRVPARQRSVGGPPPLLPLPCFLRSHPPTVRRATGERCFGASPLHAFLSAGAFQCSKARTGFQPFGVAAPRQRRRPLSLARTRAVSTAAAAAPFRIVTLPRPNARFPFS